MAQDILPKGSGPAKGLRRSRWFLLPAAALLFSGILLAVHGYLADRLIWQPEWPGPVQQGLLVGLIVLCASLVLQPLAQRLLPLRLEAILAWPASLWMGTLFFLCLLLLASDLGIWLVEATGWLGSIDPVRLSRIRVATVVVILVPWVGWAIRQGTALPGVKRVEIELKRWPAGLDGLRLVQISDVHFSAIRGSGFASWLAGRIVGLEPDLIAVTGDLVDGDAARLAPELRPLEALRAPLGTYFVTGNHDHYSGADQWLVHFRELGMQVLRNEHRVLEAGGAEFVIAGVDDHNSRHLPGGYGEDLVGALAGVPESRPVLLLAHDPATFKAARQQSVDLQISGHTHGGQIWPFNYLVRLSVPFVAGLYRRDGASLYVSRGTGFWGPPMRFRSPAEITEIVLRAAAS